MWQIKKNRSSHTCLSLSLSLCASALFSECRRGAALSVKHRYYVASLVLHASIAKITAQLLLLSYVCLILSDDGMIRNQDFCVQINTLEGRAGYVVLMGHVSVAITYSFHCLTTEAVKYINENSFIENLAASKYNVYMYTFCIVQKKWAGQCAKK